MSDMHERNGIHRTQTQAPPVAIGCSRQVLR